MAITEQHGTIIGFFLAVITIGVANKFIQKKIKKEVKVIENVTYPKEKSKEETDGTRTEPTNTTANGKHNSKRRNKKKRPNRTSKRRGSIQNESSESIPSSSGRVEGNEDTIEPLGDPNAEIEFIEE